MWNTRKLSTSLHSNPTLNCPPPTQDHSFANATGLGCELSGAQRLKRFSMLVENGVVKSVNVEKENNNMGVSSADRMLEVLGQ